MALARIHNNTFPFYQHFKATCDLLPPLVHMCLLPFEKFIMQQMVWLQDSISECLHHHTLFNMLFDRISEAHCAWILSCYSLGAGTMLTVQTSLLNLLIIFPNFFTTHQMWLGLPHPSIANIPQCMCTHPIDLVSIHFLHCAHGNEHTWIHGAVHDTFITIMGDIDHIQLHLLIG